MQNYSNPLVSVAIVTYNQKEFSKEAIESVLLQDYEPLEIVIGDDGSTDGTHELLQEYRFKYPDKFVLYLGKKNIGLTNNANKVHFACKGKYIAWLGGDDLMLPGKLMKQVTFMEAHPDCNLLYHNLDVFDNETGKTLRLYNSKHDKYTGDVRQLIKHGTFNGACSTMVRRSASPEFGHDSRIPQASDWLYWVEHLVKGGKVYMIDEVLGRYRRHNKNVSSRNSPFSIQGLKDVFNTCSIIIEKYPQFEKEVNYRRSVYYRGIRHDNYLKYLQLSIKYNHYNYKSLFLMAIHLITFKNLTP